MKDPFDYDKFADNERKRIDFPRRDPVNFTDHPKGEYDEEFAAEITPTTSLNNDWDTAERREDNSDRSDDKERSDVIVNNAGRTVGYVGLGLGIASLFLWSIVLGPLAAVLGFYAYSQGTRTAGAWAIGLGVVATLSYFFLIPFSR
jgi:hypothetical protein